MRRREHTQRRRARIAIPVLIALLLAGCGTAEPPNPTPIPEATVVSPPSATTVPETGFGEVVWSNSLTPDGAPGDPLDAFWRGNDAIYASVMATNLVSGETLTATWSINQIPIDAIDTVVSIANDASSGWVIFSLTWEGAALWPTGTLTVMITTNTGVSTTGSIEIISGQ